jgi:23S rRNA U2552 (ribose-2'-O)-methylase RlmE/FtsJ
MNVSFSDPYLGTTGPSKEDDRVGIPPDLFYQAKKGLQTAKEKIDPVYKEWDTIKPSLHDYEFVYTSSNGRKNIANKIPVSRSYFKMKEMLQAHEISVPSDGSDGCMRVVCAAEAPGGFLQCLLEMGITDLHGITLVSRDKKVPYWNRALVSTLIQFHTGLTKDGDLYNFRNILAFVKEIGAGTVDLVTGDGGFDNSGDYNHQEENSFKLIYSEVYLALLLQKKGGTFICKMFDTFEAPTVALLDILRSCYEDVSLYKPCISRISNSEKYVVCKGFRGYTVKQMNHLTHHFEDTQIDKKASRAFLKEMIQYTKGYTGQQIQSIERGLRMICETRDRGRLPFPSYRDVRPTRLQIAIAKEWCQTYDVPINWECQYL